MTDADGSDWPPTIPPTYDELMEGTGMTTADPTARLRGRRDRLETQLRHLDEQLQLLGRFPDNDPYKDGTVVRFQLRWQLGTVYTYAAVRAVGQWFTTASGSSRVHRSWLALIEWITTAAEIVSFEEMVPGYLLAEVPETESEPAGPVDPYAPTVVDGLQRFPDEAMCLSAVRHVVHLPHRWGYSNDDRVFVCDGYAVPAEFLPDEDRSQ